MKTKKYLYIALASFAFASCNSEDPFEGDGKEGDGRFLTSSIDLEVKGDDFATRSVGVPAPEEFTVSFYSADENSLPQGEALQTYLYTKMPEVVSLPVGRYVAQATYGGNYGEGKNAAFDAPYYKGTSESFEISLGSILDNLSPVVCRPANVKVSVSFDKELLDVMGEGGKVSVRVGESGVLDFTPNTDAEGYFAYDEGSTTLTATFTGVVQGVQTSEIKTFDGVKPGLFYRVAFKLHRVDPNEPVYPEEPVEGDIVVDKNDGSGIKLDASVSYKDVYGDEGLSTDFVEDEYLEDDLRPGGSTADDNTGGENPGEGDNKDPENPDEDDPTNPDNPDKTPPTFKEVGSTKEKNYDPEEFSVDILSSSEKGFTGFVVDIISDSLTPEVLVGVNLTDHIDLIHPGEFGEKIKALGFPIEDGVEGQQKVNVSIDPSFLGLLRALGKSNTEFKFTVTDEYGTTVKSYYVIITKDAE